MPLVQFLAVPRDWIEINRWAGGTRVPEGHLRNLLAWADQNGLVRCVQTDDVVRWVATGAG